MTEILKPNVLPIREHNLNQKAEIFTAAREFGLPVINLKTGQTGKGEGCPNSCGYCDVGDKDGPYWRETDEDNFKSIIINWAQQGGKIIHWCGDGEPTTFKWFDIILDLAQKYNFKLEMFSALNGLTPKRATKLMEIGATVKFKMDSRNPLILGKIMHKDANPNQALITGISTLKKIDMLIEAQKKSKKSNQLVASIVMSQINKKDIIEDLDWCCQNNIVPQIAYMEEVGAAINSELQPLTEKQIRVINRWLRTKYQIDPKQVMGDQCQAKSAPIVIGDKIYLGPFGMGCEFPLREHICELNFIGNYKDNIQKTERSINEFRFSQRNINNIINELTKIRNQQGTYSQTGTDKLLPGCGDDIEELWLLEYVATTFTSDEYFNNFIEKWVLAGEHRKWTESEINDLISQVKMCVY